MNDRSLARHLLVIVLVKIAVLMGIWQLFVKPYKVHPSVLQVSQAVLGSPNLEGASHAKP